MYNIGGIISGSYRIYKRTLILAKPERMVSPTLTQTFAHALAFCHISYTIYIDNYAHAMSFVYSTPTLFMERAIHLLLSPRDRFTKEG